MPSVNKVILLGHIGQDPRTTTTQNDHQVTEFSMATTTKFKDNKITEWHNIVCWNQNAKYIAQYGKKGGIVYVCGRKQTRSYDNKDGLKVYKTDIVADEVSLIKNKEEVPF